MKAGKKPKGTKARVQAYKKRFSYIATVTTVAILVAIITISGFLIYSFLNPSPRQTIDPDQINPTSQLKAAIVDHLSLTAPNHTFKQTATTILEEAGYTVDYYPGEEVTVEFYRNLPTHGYSLIVLRVHSATTVGYRSLGLFSSEVRSTTKYVYEQLTEQLVGARFPNDETEYFGISPLFVLHSMKGRFQNTTIIHMGCDGLVHTTMAEAFRQKGAKVYISWDGDVLASHTDQATTHLLQHLIAEKQTIEHAVTKTREKVGPDPAYKSLLVYYPLEAGDQTIEAVTSTQTSHSFFGVQNPLFTRPLVSLRFLLIE